MSESLTEVQKKMIPDIIKIREALNAVYESELSGDSDERVADSKKELLNAYQAFVVRYGNLIKHRALILRDIDGDRILGLEKIEKRKVTGLS